MLGWEVIIVGFIIALIAIYAAAETVVRVAEAVAEHFDIAPPLAPTCSHGWPHPAFCDECSDEMD